MRTLSKVVFKLCQFFLIVAVAMSNGTTPTVKKQRKTSASSSVSCKNYVFTENFNEIELQRFNYASYIFMNSFLIICFSETDSSEKQEPEYQQSRSTGSKTWKPLVESTISWEEKVETECAICVSELDLEKFSNVYTLECRHTFHTEVSIKTKKCF